MKVFILLSPNMKFNTFILLPRTSQIVGTAKRRHKHILETELTLLHQASIPFQFWFIVYQMTIYLINQTPTPLLGNKSPLEALSHTSLNYHKLNIFAHLCYPWLKPKTHHKLDLKHCPCVFLSYSLSHNSYQCYDPSTLINNPISIFFTHFMCLYSI